MRGMLKRGKYDQIISAATGAKAMTAYAVKALQRT